MSIRQQAGAAFAALLLTAQPALCQMSMGMGMYGARPASPALPTMPTSRLTPKLRALLALRHEAIDLQKDDGGTLSDSHRAYLQQKLDAIQAEYPEPSQAQSQQSQPPAQSPSQQTQAPAQPQSPPEQSQPTLQSRQTQPPPGQ